MKVRRMLVETIDNLCHCTNLKGHWRLMASTSWNRWQIMTQRRNNLWAARELAVHPIGHIVARLIGLAHSRRLITLHWLTRSRSISHVWSKSSVLLIIHRQNQRRWQIKAVAVKAKERWALTHVSKTQCKGYSRRGRRTLPSRLQDASKDSEITRVSKDLVTRWRKAATTIIWTIAEWIVTDLCVYLLIYMIIQST